MKELINEEFLYLWKVPDLTWNIQSVGTKQDIGLFMNFIFH